MQIKDIATLRAEIEALKARQKAVEGLQTDRNVPVHLLDELVKQTPEGVYLTSIKQSGQVVLVSGLAQTNERVSEFLRNTLYNSPWLEKPELVEIKTAASGNSPTASWTRSGLWRGNRSATPRPRPSATGNSWPTLAKTSRSPGHSVGPMKSSGACGPTFHSSRDS